MAEWEITDGHRASSSGLVILSEAKQLQLTVAFVEAWSIFVRAVITNVKGNARKNRGCPYSGALRRKHLETSEKKKKNTTAVFTESRLGSPDKEENLTVRFRDAHFINHFRFLAKTFCFVFRFHDWCSSTASGIQTRISQTSSALVFLLMAAKTKPIFFPVFFHFLFLNFKQCPIYLEAEFDVESLIPCSLPPK